MRKTVEKTSLYSNILIHKKNSVWTGLIAKDPIFLLNVASVMYVQSLVYLIIQFKVKICSKLNLEEISVIKIILLLVLKCEYHSRRLLRYHMYGLCV